MMMGSLTAQEPFQVMGRHETCGQSPGPEDLSVSSKAGPKAEQHGRMLYVPLYAGVVTTFRATIEIVTNGNDL